MSIIYSVRIDHLFVAVELLEYLNGTPAQRFRQVTQLIFEVAKVARRVDNLCVLARSQWGQTRYKSSKQLCPVKCFQPVCPNTTG